MKTESLTSNFPIVCVGGSSADVDAYTLLLRNLRPDLGIAIVIVNHLSLLNDRLLQELPNFTTMPVEPITDGLSILRNRVYLSAEDRDLHVQEGVFRLKLLSKPTGWPDVITVFLDSLAKHWNGKLIAVIYSGYDGDGAVALRCVKEAGGVVMARKAEATEQPDMPLSAVATGFVDFILSIEDIAKEIERIALSELKTARSVARE
jgi:two-component system chemotaxis response regulator CheB